MLFYQTEGRIQGFVRDLGGGGTKNSKNHRKFAYVHYFTLYESKKIYGRHHHDTPNSYSLFFNIAGCASWTSVLYIFFL